MIPSSSTRRVLLGAFEHGLEVWDLGARRLVGSLSTIFDFGGSRVALSDELDIVVAGAYQRRGLVGYSPELGVVQWERKDLKKIQKLSLSADGTRVFCGREGFPCEVVDVESGETLGRLKGTRTVVESPWEPVRLSDRWKPVIEDQLGKTLFLVPRLSFAFLDVAFAPGKLFISESGGLVRCLSTESGKELWRYLPNSGAHVLRLAYCSDDDSVGGVEWPYEQGGPRTLLSLSASNGAYRAVHEIAGTDQAFCDRGRCVVTSTREVLASTSAAVLYKLESDRAG